jgi:hypothetical protein
LRSIIHAGTAIELLQATGGGPLFRGLQRKIFKRPEYLPMSLLESCAGIAIISSVVVFAAPSFIKARENYQLDGVARQLAGKMQWTRIKAISRNRDCRIRVNSPTSYVIECEDPSWKTDETVVLPGGFRITATAAPEFHVRGNVAPTATLVVWDKYSKTKRVIVNITGRVRVE